MACRSQVSHPTSQEFRNQMHRWAYRSHPFAYSNATTAMITTTAMGMLQNTKRVEGSGMIGLVFSFGT